MPRKKSGGISSAASTHKKGIIAETNTGSDESVVVPQQLPIDDTSSRMTTRSSANKEIISLTPHLSSPKQSLHFLSTPLKIPPPKRRSETTEVIHPIAATNFSQQTMLAPALQQAPSLSLLSSSTTTPSLLTQQQLKETQQYLEGKMTEGINNLKERFASFQQQAKGKTQMNEEQGQMQNVTAARLLPPTFVAQPSPPSATLQYAEPQLSDDMPTSTASHMMMSGIPSQAEYIKSGNPSFYRLQQQSDEKLLMCSKLPHYIAAAFCPCVYMQNIFKLMSKNQQQGSRGELIAFYATFISCFLDLPCLFCINQFSNRTLDRMANRAYDNADDDGSDNNIGLFDYILKLGHFGPFKSNEDTTWENDGRGWYVFILFLYPNTTHWHIIIKLQQGSQ